VTGAIACRWDGNLIAAEDAVLVGATERGSGPPLLIYACTACVAVRLPGRRRPVGGVQGRDPAGAGPGVAAVLDVAAAAIGVLV
jgi:hypothetical protein